MKCETTISAHSGTISDLDVKENLLVTCGYVLRNGSYVFDPLVKVFDLRNNKLLSQMHFSYGPSWGIGFLFSFSVKFSPRLSTQVCVVSQNGFYQFKDCTCDQNTSIAYQLETRGQLLEGFDISSCGEVLGFSDANGHVHVWNSQQYFHINNFSNETELPTMLKSPNELENTGFESFSIIESHDESDLLSNWNKPPHYVIAQHPLRVHPEIMSNLKKYHRIGALPNPGIENVFQGYSMNINGKSLQVIPDSYERINMSDLEEGKQRFESLDLSKYNKSGWIGLENNNLADNWINALIQSLYHVESLRIALINHNCNRDLCCACELGFLYYRMDRLKTGDFVKVTNANNFFRTIQQIPEAKGQGILSNDPFFIVDPARRVQKFNSFLLTQLQVELSTEFYSLTSFDRSLFKRNFTQSLIQNSSQKKAGLIPILFGHNTSTESTCSTCHAKESKVNQQLVVEVKGAFDNLVTHLEKSQPCSRCGKPKSATVKRELLDLPNILNINFSTAQPLLGPLPSSFAISLEKSERNRFKIEKDDHVTNTKGKACFELFSVVSLVKNPLDTSKGHLVTSIRQGKSWLTFNDFQVVEESEYLQKPWKIPLIVVYCRTNLHDLTPKMSFKSSISSAPFLKNSQLCIKIDMTKLPSNNDIVGIDVECYATDSNSSLSIGRITVLLENDTLPFIDDYISTTGDVYDYLTRFSGLKLGDLDPKLSSHHVTSLKQSYLKLRYLVDNGICFVGHGLENDFKILNLWGLVPKSQIIDTLEIFRLPGQRKISLRFLCIYCLGKDIQQETHDSIVDAQVSLQLYKLYKQTEPEKFANLLTSIYETGRFTNWDVEILQNLKK